MSLSKPKVLNQTDPCRSSGEPNSTSKLSGLAEFRFELNSVTRKRLSTVLRESVARQSRIVENDVNEESEPTTSSTVTSSSSTPDETISTAKSTAPCSHQHFNQESISIIQFMKKCNKQLIQFWNLN